EPTKRPLTPGPPEPCRRWPLRAPLRLTYVDEPIVCGCPAESTIVAQGLTGTVLRSSGRLQCDPVTVTGACSPKLRAGYGAVRAAAKIPRPGSSPTNPCHLVLDIGDRSGHRTFVVEGEPLLPRRTIKGRSQQARKWFIEPEDSTTEVGKGDRM